MGVFAISDRGGQSKVERKREIAIHLREKGHTIRFIMKALKYKSPRSVQTLLEK